MKVLARQRARVTLLFLVALPTTGCAEFWSAGPNFALRAESRPTDSLNLNDPVAFVIGLGILGIVAIARAVEPLFRPELSRGGIPWDSPEGMALRHVP
jgi:hypothetical protein